MKARTKPTWQLSEGDRARLLAILADIPPDATETDPAFLRLLEAWEAAAVPWNALLTVPCYHARDGSWLTGGVPAVVDAIRVHVGEPSPADRTRPATFVRLRRNSVILAGGIRRAAARERPRITVRGYDGESHVPEVR